MADVCSRVLELYKSILSADNHEEHEVHEVRAQAAAATCLFPCSWQGCGSADPVEILWQSYLTAYMDRFRN